MSELTIASTSSSRARSAQDRWRVARIVAAKEWAEMWRDARFLWLFALAVLLMLGALAFGATQHQRMDHERASASLADRKLWTQQGAKDPHAAAHFGQYAFKPVSPLALADPGVDAYVGTAVWLEAHKQNEAQFKTARDGGVASRLGGLSLAFVLQTILPLIAILLGFSSFSGERERGTLRQLLSLGASPVDLLAGKALATTGALAGLFVPALACALLIACLFSDLDHFSLFDQIARAAALTVGYGLYLAGFVFLALAVSALAKSSRAALVALLTFWLANCFLAPRIMTDVARGASPLPTAQQFRAAISEDKKKTFGHDEAHPGFVAFKNEILKRYGVTRIEDLAVNFRGLALRKDDENGFAIFDRHFGALQAAFDEQDKIRSAPGFVLPALALQPWSASFAGTDGWHQYDFSVSAEAHRRQIQNTVSDVLIHKGRYGDKSFVAGPELWEKIASFDYHSPGAAWAFSHVAGDLASLVAWFTLTAGLAVYAARRLRPV